MGTQPCLDDGTGFGPCSGDVVPAPEDCATTSDESCDGAYFDGCPGQIEAIDSIPGWAVIHGMAEHPAGGIVAVGAYQGTIGLGAGTLTADGLDAFIVRYDASANHLWSAGYGGPGTQVLDSVVVHPSGQIIASAYQTAPTSWGGAVATGMGSTQGVILEYEPSGSLLSQSILEATGSAYGTVTGIAPNDDWLLSWRFSGEMTIGGLTLTGAPNTLVAARWTPGANIQWLHVLAAEPYVKVTLRPHPGGGVLIHGYFHDTLELNGVTYDAPPVSFAHFYGRLYDDGQTTWLKTFSGGSNQSLAGFNATRSGDLLLGVQRPALNDFGAGVVPGSWEFAFARFDADGELSWSSVLGTPSSGGPDLTMAEGASHGLMLAFEHDAADIDWGGGSLPLIDDSPVFVRFDGAGEALWYRTASEMSLGQMLTTSDGRTWVAAYGSPGAELGGVAIPEGLNVALLSP